MQNWFSQFRSKWHKSHSVTRPQRLWEQLEERVLFDATGEMDLAALVEGEGAFDPEATSVDSSEACVLATADSPLTSATPSRELVIVDTSVEGYQQFVDDILGNTENQNAASRDIEVVLLDADQNGVDTIAELLTNYGDIDAMHIVSHGTDAGVQLGNLWLTAANLSQHSENLANWGNALSSGGDLLFYGCDLGSSESGRQLVNSIGSLTGADVAASVDDTGYAPRGGDWDLEYSLGEVQADVVFSASLQAEFQGLLAPGPNVTLNVPSQVPLGEDVNFSVTFQNTGPSGDVGYGPFIDVLIPHLGEDGVYDNGSYTDTQDGLDVAASGAVTYLGQAVNYEVITFADTNGAGGPAIGVAEHPYAVAIQNETQLLGAESTVTGGTFTLTFDGQTTADIAWDANAATVQSALLALSNIDPGEVSVTGADLPGGVMEIEFIGSLAQTDVAEITVDSTLLTGGNAGVVTLVDGDAEEQAMKVYGNAGDKLLVIELPFGSFTPEQPAATVNINATMSNLADLNAPLELKARGGFRYGEDATNNPATDPTLLSDSQARANGWVESDSVTPTLLQISKVYSGPEGETATGPSYPRQWTMRMNIPAGQTVTDLDIFDDLPNNIVFLSLDSITSVDGGTSFTTNVPLANNSSGHTGANSYGTLDVSGPVNGQSLAVTADSVTGTSSSQDVTVTFSYYISEFDADGNRVIPITGEDDTTSTPDSRSHNNARAVGDFTPVDGRDSGGTDNAVADPAGDESTVDAKSIAIQKSRTIVDASGVPISGATNVAPGSYVRYTLSFQISDYYTYGDLVLTDVFDDGLRFVQGGALNPEFTVSDFNNTLTSQGFNVHVGGENAAPTPAGADNFIVDQSEIDNTDNASENAATNGTTTVTIELSERMAQLGDDGILQGGLTDGDTNQGSATGTITFYVQVQDEYSDTFDSGDRSVDQGDVLGNTVTIDGSVRENEEDNGSTFGTLLASETDGSSASVSVAQGTLTKTIYAINGSTTFGDPVEVAPGDQISYRLTYELPTSDFEDLVITDYFPLPVFTVGDPDGDDVAGPGWTFDSDTSTTNYTPGVVELLPTDTFFNSDPGSSDYFANGDITVDTVANSVTLDFGTYDNTGAAATTIDLILTVTVQDDPFADGLFLTNQAQADEGTTNGTPSSEVDLIQLTLTQPVVAQIRKGIVDTSKTTAFSGTDGGNTVDFTETGATADFTTGTLNSDWLAGVTIDDTISDLDAGDTVRFVVIVENTGTSRKGAFDVNIADTLGPGFTYVDDSLQVYDGTGTALSYTGTDNDLFGAGIELDDPGNTAAQPDGTDEGALDEFDATDGENIAVLIYDVTIDTGVEPTLQYDNTADLTYYAGTEGGANHLLSPEEAIASVTIAEPTIAKELEGTSVTAADGSGVNGDNQAVIGELIQYKVTMTVPEGTIEGAEIFDRLDAGLAFVQIDSIAASAGLASDQGDMNLAGDWPNFGPTIANGGRDLTFDFGTITNSDTNEGATETIEITYSVRVTNVATNQSTAEDSGPNLNNRARFQWDTNDAGGHDEQTANASAATVSIIEPVVQIDKELTSTGSDAGDVVVYQITIDHAAASEADAFDMTFFDNVPDEIVYDFSGVAITHMDDSLNVVDLNVKDKFRLNPGDPQRLETIPGESLDLLTDETITIVITGTIANDVGPGTEISNRADVDWTSLNDDEISGSGTSNERDGVDGQGGALDNYATFDVETFTTSSVTLVKDLVSTSIDNSGTTNTNNNTQAVIGETAIYRVTLTIPEGETNSAKIIDSLDLGLQFEATTSVSVVGEETPGNFTSSTVDFTDPSSITVTDNGEDGISGAQVVTFDFGDITNSESDAGDEQIVIEYRVRVTGPSDVGNDTGESASLDNSAIFQWDIGNATPEETAADSAAAIAVIEPDLDIAKSVVVAGSGTSGDAGDSVVYTIDITHAATSTDAFDVVFTDAVSSKVIYDIDDVTVEITHVDTSTTDITSQFEVVGNTLQLKTSPSQESFDLLDGESVEITINGVLASTVSPNESLDNTATIKWTSLDDDEISGSSTSNERDGEDGAGSAPNDYAETSANAAVTIAPPTFTKHLFATDQTETSGSEVTIGETVTYALFIELSEGTTADATIVDQIPTGMDYTGFQIVTTAAASGGLLAADFNGTIAGGAPTVTGGGGDGADTTFTFGQIDVVNDNVGNNNAFLILVDAVVLDVASNVGYGPSATTLTNSATIDFSFDSETPQAVASDIDVTVVEPNLAITKEFGGGTADVDKANAGDTVSFDITLENTGDGTAYDVAISDVINGAHYDLSSVDFGTSGVDYPTGWTANYVEGTGTLTYSGGTLAAGASVTFTVTADLTTTVDPGDALVNTANLIAVSSLDGAEAGERTDTDPDGDGSDTDADTMTIRTNSIAGNIYSDADNDGVFDGGESGINDSNMRVTLTGTDYLGDDVSVTITPNADGSYIFDGLRPSDATGYTVTQTVGPAAFIDGKDTAGSAGGTAGNDIITGIVLPTNTETSATAYNFGETAPASISNFVWYDIDGDGVYDDGSGADPAEPGLPFVDLLVTAAGQDGTFGTADDFTFTPTTDQNGMYSVGNLPAGLYRVGVTSEPAGMTQTAETDDGANNIAGVAEFSLNPGQDRTDIDFGFTGDGSIGDTIYWDADGDGTQDDGSGADPAEAGIPNVTVTLEIDLDQNGSFDHTRTITTDDNGNYTFGNLPAVDYRVTVTQPAGTTQTDDPDASLDNVSTLTLGDGADIDDQDFGYRGDYTIGDIVFWDVNNNGVYNAGVDRGLEGVTVTLESSLDGDAAMEYTATTTTDANGAYSFANLIPGDYTITVTPATVPGGMSVNPTTDGDGTGTPHTSDVTITNADNTAQDFGYTGTASLGDLVWFDADGDGVKDTDEPGLADIGVTITWAGNDNDLSTTDDNEVFTQATGADGSYDFTSLAAGLYRVDVEHDDTDLPGSLTLTTANDTHETTLTAGEDHNSSDFGFTGTRDLGDFVWFDADKDGVQDTGEPGMGGVELTLQFAGQDGVFGTIAVPGDDVFYDTTTDANGAYSYGNLANGNYRLAVDPASLPDAVSQTYEIDGVALGDLNNRSDFTINGANRADIDFGYAGDRTLGDRVWFDANGDGVQDAANEPGFANTEVTLTFAGLDDTFGNDDDFTLTTTTDANGNYEFDNLPQGEYRVSVDQSNFAGGMVQSHEVDGTANNQANVSLAGSNIDNVDFGFRGVGTIGDHVFFDFNGDGSENGDDVGYPNLTLTITGDIDGDGNDETFTVVTDENGDYSLSGLPQANYTVALTPPSGTSPTFDSDGTGTPNTSDVTLTAGSPSSATQDFGLRGTGTVGDTIFFDENGDGVQNGDEDGIPGVTVTIEVDLDGDGDSDFTTTAITDADGNYSFGNLPAGDVTVTVTDPAGTSPTTNHDGSAGGDNSSSFALAAGETNNVEDFGFRGTGVVGNFVWFDADADGVQDVGEPGLPGVTVALDIDFNGDGTYDHTLTATTGADGSYSFTDLAAGDYRVRVTQLAGTTQTGDPDSTLDNQSEFTLAAGATNNDQDFGYRGNGSISDIVYFDYLGDGGVYNPGESDRGMAGVDVTLTIDVNGDTTPDYTVTQTTDANGNYAFSNLIPGMYTIATDSSDLPDQMGNNPTYDADSGTTGLGNTADVVLGVDENNSAVDFGYHATPDYNITKTDGNLTVVTGQSISYTITLRNDGTFRGLNTVVSDTFPTNILTNVSASGGGIIDNNAGTITWNATTTPELAVMSVGEEIVITVTGDVVALADGGNDSLVNAVSVTDDQYNGIDPNLADNSVQDIDQLVDITTLKNVTSLVANGDNWDITFEVVVENTGSVQLNDLTLVDDLAAQFGAAFVSVTTPTIDSSGMTGGGTPPTVNSNWRNNTASDMLDPAATGEVLMPGESFTLTFTATLNPDASGTSSTLDNSATAGGSDTTTNPGTPRTVADVSDSGTAPTTTNPGEPGDTGGESDATPLYIPDIAIAKQQGTTTRDTTTGNWFVAYTFFVENVGTVSLDNLTLTDDIATQFGNAYVAVTGLTVQNFSGTGTAPAANTGWESDTAASMIDAAGAQLDAGDSFEVTFVVEINPDGVDGLSHAATNQATTSGRGLDELGNPLLDGGGDDIFVSDLSDSGSNANGTNATANGDAGTSDDPTPLVIPEIGVAKRLVSTTSSGVGGNRNLTYEIVIRNIGTVDLTNLTLTEDFEDRFGDAFVRVATGGDPTLTASTATQDPTLNGGWNGNQDFTGDAEVFNGTTGLLKPGEEVTVRYVVEVDIDQLMTGSSNQVTSTGDYDVRPGIVGNDGTVSDLSDTGSDPAGNNPMQPGDTGGFDDPTLVPAVGIAKNHGDFTTAGPDGQQFSVPVTLVVENVGATELNNFSLIEDLRDQFGAAFVEVSTPTIDNSNVTGTPLAINSAWETDTSQSLLQSSGWLRPGNFVAITFNVTIDPDATGTATALSNQATITASDPANASAIVQDLSDSGSNASSTNPGQPGDEGTADDRTPVQLPDAGVTKQISNVRLKGLTSDLTIEIVLENTGTVDLVNLELYDDLASQYDINFSQIVGEPEIVASTATLNPTFSGAYAGDTSVNMLDGASGRLKPGESITVQLVVEVQAGPGEASATLVNQASGGGTAIDENDAPLRDEGGTLLQPVIDDSDSGSDPNGSNPSAPGDMAGFDDPTSTDVTFFTFDNYNNFAIGFADRGGDTGNDAGMHSKRLLTQEISTLAPEPIFSGSARPGTQIVGKIYNSSGVLIGEEMSFADVGGNWMMQFHDIASLDHARVQFVEQAGIGNPFAPNGDAYGYLGLDGQNNNYASLEPWTPYGESFDFNAVYRGSARSSLMRMHQVNNSPLGFGSFV